MTSILAKYPNFKDYQFVKHEQYENLNVIRYEIIHVIYRNYNYFFY